MSRIEIKRAIEKYFHEQNWRYNFEENNFVFMTVFDIELENIKYVQYSIFVYDDHATSIMHFPLKVGAESRIAVSEFINRVNFVFDIGCWEFNPDSYEIRFRTNAFFQEITSGTNIAIARLIHLPYQMLNEIGNYLVKVISGQLGAQEAVEEILKNRTSL